jgi:hypothetical protein
MLLPDVVFAVYTVRQQIGKTFHSGDELDYYDVIKSSLLLIPMTVSAIVSTKNTQKSTSSSALRK